MSWNLVTCVMSMCKADYTIRDITVIKCKEYRWKQLELQFSQIEVERIIDELDIVGSRMVLKSSSKNSGGLKEIILELG